MKVSLRLAIALVAVAFALAMMAGCGGGNTPYVSVPKFYVQTAPNATIGPWTQAPLANDAVTVRVSPFLRVLVDSGGASVNTMTVHNTVTGKDDPYVAGTIVSWPAGCWIFRANVTDQHKNYDLVLTLTISPATELTDFRVSVIASPGYTPIAPDAFGIARVAEGQEVYFWVGGSAYPIGTATRGGFGGVDGVAITGTFWTIEGEGGKYLPVEIPFTQGNSYRLYHPLNGEYIVTASFLYEGKLVTTAPPQLHGWGMEPAPIGAATQSV